MTSLPKSIVNSLPCPKGSTLEASALSAYDVCLDFEDRSKTGTEEDTIHARVLGYLIIHAPSGTALQEVADGIHSCSNDDNDLFNLSKLGEYYVNYFIRSFKKYKGRTPASSSHSSRPSFDKDKEKWAIEIKEAPKDHKEAKRQALIRDGFKCIVSGIYDDNALKLEIPSIDKEVVRQEGTVFTECAHIVPQSNYFDVSTSPDKEDYSTSLLAVLERFGYNVDNLNGTKLHSLHNVMTMEYNVRDWFDRLKLWFEATSIPHCYHVKAASGYFPATARRRTTTFVTSDSELSLPSPELLALHAACAKVAHFSGAAGYIDKLDRDTDDLCVLAHDGGSSSILNNALLRSLSSTINAGA